MCERVCSWWSVPLSCQLLPGTISMKGLRAVLSIWHLLTYEAYDAADKGVEVTTVSCHNGFLLGQESLPRWFHHIHGHLSDENLHTQKMPERERQKKEEIQKDSELKIQTERAEDCHIDKKT